MFRDVLHLQELAQIGVVRNVAVQADRFPNRHGFRNIQCDGIDWEKGGIVVHVINDNLEVENLCFSSNKNLMKEQRKKGAYCFAKT